MDEVIDHEADMEKNIRRFRGEFEALFKEKEAEVSKLDAKIGAYIKYKEYIFKSRQANHLKTVHMALLLHPL